MGKQYNYELAPWAHCQPSVFQLPLILHITKLYTFVYINLMTAILYFLELKSVLEFFEAKSV